MGDNMRKRFYIFTFILLSLTIVLFSVSYSKDSGEVQYTTFNTKKNNLKVIYENNNIFKVETVSKIDDFENLEANLVNVINLGKKKVSYALYIMDDKAINKVYYSIKDGEKALIDDKIIYLGDLNKFGKSEDTANLKLRFFSLEEYKEDLQIDIITINKDSLGYKVLAKDSTYNKNGVYYFYKNDNYVKYKDNIYRILSYDGKNIKMVNFGSEEKYNDKTNYLTKEDLFNTFNNDKVNENNIAEFDSWLKEEVEFWLKGKTFYSYNIFYNGDDDVLVKTSNVIEIDGESIIVNGDGKKESPYEVKYES